MQAFAQKNAEPRYAVLLTPDARGAIEDVSTGRDAVYASIFENVTGAIHAFQRDRSGTWSDTALDLPKGGSTHVVDSRTRGRRKPISAYESFLQPVTLYAYDGGGAPRAIKSEPARFDAGELVSRAVLGDIGGRHEGPVFPYPSRRMRASASPTILYSYGGFELSLEPWYWNDGHRPLDAGPDLARQRRRDCGRQHPRRRRVRTRMASGGAEDRIASAP